MIRKCQLLKTGGFFGAHEAVSSAVIHNMTIHNIMHVQIFVYCCQLPYNNQNGSERGMTNLIRGHTLALKTRLLRLGILLKTYGPMVVYIKYWDARGLKYTHTYIDICVCPI